MPTLFPIIPFMSDVSPAAVKKIQTLVQIAEDLRHGKHFEITRLTMLKSFCSDPVAGAKFALHLAKKTQHSMKARGCPRYTEPAAWQQYRRLVGKAVRGMAGYLKRRTRKRSHRSTSCCRRFETFRTSTSVNNGDQSA